MKFPFILRSDHDEIVLALKLSITSHQFTNESLAERLREKDREIESLIAQLTAQNPAPVDGATKEKKKFVPTHLSYRQMAQNRSRETIKPPADSAAALEEKVKREGGTV